MLSSNNNVKTLKTAVKNSHAIIIVTDHTSMINDLKKLNLNSLGVKVVIDGRNCLDPNSLKILKFYIKELVDKNL